MYVHILYYYSIYWSDTPYIYDFIIVSLIYKPGSQELPPVKPIG